MPGGLMPLSKRMPNEEAWRRAESDALEYASLASSWLQSFFSIHLNKRSYFIQFTDDRPVGSPPDRHTATYQIMSGVLDYTPEFFSRSELEVWEPVRVASNRLLTDFNEDPSLHKLPFQNLGLLPLFSTSYRAEVMGFMENPLKLPSYALVLRRILFELTSNQDIQWSRPHRSNTLHPFLLYGCARSLFKFREHIIRGTNQTRLIAEFRQFLLDDALLERTFSNSSDAKRANYSKADFESVYGPRSARGENSDTGFKNEVLAQLIADDGAPGHSLNHNLDWIENASVNCAVGEIAGNKLKNYKGDSSSLAFALLTLSTMDQYRMLADGHSKSHKRHTALISEGIKLLLKQCRQGNFFVTSPFHIDEKGRALFVTSVEIANALLTTAANVIDSLSDDDFSVLLRTTHKIQNRLVEGYNRVDVPLTNGDRETRMGWCSDRAPSPNRIDSWVTAQVLLFFFKHIETVRMARRRHILKDYTWSTGSKIKVDWKDLIDADYPSKNTGTKHTIKHVIENADTLSKAPVFLLYGPPGTSKTTVVEALAKRQGWDLVKLSPSDFVVKSLDKIELRARKIFNDLMKLDKCIILMDELDALLKDRDSLSETSPGSIMEFVAPALLPKIQDLRDYALDHHMAVFFVTNYYEKIDRALSRDGRIDNHLLILPYSKQARMEIARSILSRRKVSDIDAKLNILDSALSHSLCNLVYRDMTQVVDFFLGGASESQITDFANTIGVLPEIYSYKRIAAFREFVAYLQRIQGEDVDYAGVSSLSKNDAELYLAKVSNTFSNSGRVSTGSFIGGWAQRLRDYAPDKLRT
jgi:hypothetical protein